MGYRYYVDMMMKQKELSGEQAEFLRNKISENIGHIDFLMRETAKAISLLTNYTTIISEPQITKTKIRQLQLIGIDDVTALLVFVTDSKIVKQSTFRLDRSLSYDELSSVSKILTSMIANVSYDEMNGDFKRSLAKKLGKYAFIVDPVIDLVLNTLISEANVEIYTSGAKNLLEFPEFSDLDKAKALFEALDEKQTLISLISTAYDGSVQIVIGEENDLANLKNCSIIKANYSFGGHNNGNIGIIGPTRMDYPMVISVLKNIVGNINNLIYDGGGKYDKSG
jgi:heat-inducible transcriptional repressor